MPSCRDLATMPCTGGLKIAVPVPIRIPAAIIDQKPVALAMVT